MKKLLLLLLLIIIVLPTQIINAQSSFNLQVIPAQIFDDNITIQFSTNQNTDCITKFGPTAYLSQTGEMTSNYLPRAKSYIADNDQKTFTTSYFNIVSNSDYYYTIVCESDSEIFFSDVYTIVNNQESNLDLNIIPTYNLSRNESSAEIQFSTKYLATCDLSYDESTPIRGLKEFSIIKKFADQSSDKRFHYSNTIIDLKPNTTYFYQINCTYNSQNFSETFTFNNYQPTALPDLTISDIEGNFRGDSYEVIFSTNKQAQCGVKLSYDFTEVGIIERTESINIISPPSTPTYDTKQYQMSWWYNLDPNVDFYFKITCNYNNTLVETPLYTLTNHDHYLSQYPERSNNDNTSQPKERVISDVPNNLGTKHRGKLFLQVEDKGRIWYVNPIDARRHEITFTNALFLFQELSIGITNEDLNKIPFAKDSVYLEKGLDVQQTSIANLNFADKHRGKLFLQVEDLGRIWYIDFQSQRHEVTWNNLLPLFQSLAVGITNSDLQRISSVEYK